MANPAQFKEKIREFLDKITYRQWVAAAAVVSCLLGLMVYFAISGSDEKTAEQPKTNLVQVVAAKQDIPERTVVKEDMLKVVEVPSELVPEGAFRDVEDAIDHPTSTAIQQGDIVTSRKVYVDIRMAGFTGIIPSDCRAVTIPISDVTGVSGFAHPGDYVDIMLITGTKENGMQGRLILQNVLLLAINRTSDLSNVPSGDGSSNKDSNSSDSSKDKNSSQNVNTKPSSEGMATATVALKPADVLKLAVASQEGTLYLDLRPFKPRDMYTFDTDYAGVPQATQQSQAAASAAEAPAPQAPAPQQSYSAPTLSPSAPAAPSYSSAGSSDSSAGGSVPVLGRTIEVIRGVTSTREGVQ